LTDSTNKRSPGFWRDSSRLLHIHGIPAPLFGLYIAWFRFPSWTTIYVVTGVIAVFRLLSHFGWTLKVLTGRVLYWVRGSRLSGRPWWYRRFTEGD